MYSDVDSFFTENGIKYSNPQKGHYKIKTDKYKTLMFYPKSNIIIWTKGTKAKDFQHKFKNTDRIHAFRKIKRLLSK